MAEATVAIVKRCLEALASARNLEASAALGKAWDSLADNPAEDSLGDTLAAGNRAVGILAEDSPAEAACIRADNPGAGPEEVACTPADNPASGDTLGVGSLEAFQGGGRTLAASFLAGEHNQAACLDARPADQARRAACSVDWAVRGPGSWHVNQLKVGSRDKRRGTEMSLKKAGVMSRLMTGWDHRRNSLEA